MISHSDVVVMMGSCFSDNIGARMRHAMFNVDINPFGTLYNPFSIATSIERIIDCEPVDGSHMFQSGGVWNSFLFHSKFSRVDKMRAMEMMNERITAAHEHLRQARALIITLGTAVVYRLKSTGKVVSNCHKVPQHEFVRKTESIEAMTEVLDHSLTRLREFNPDIKVIITVSPIRHVADGLETNMLSKASLRVVASTLAGRFKDMVSYFPAFEIMLDDLRDYRFYNSDMVHPSDVAIDYIYDKFLTSHCDATAISAGERCRKFSLLLQHRPMTDSDALLQRHNASIVKKANDLAASYPYLAARLSAITKKYSQ